MTTNATPAPTATLPTILERHIRSKEGHDLTDCEDSFVVTDHHCCVIDGATSPTGRRWTDEQIKGGKWAANVLSDAVRTLPPESTPTESVRLLSHSIQEAYHNLGETVQEMVRAHPEERATASMICYSTRRRELFWVGDCQALVLDVNGKTVKTIQPQKHNDVVMAQARAMMLHIERIMTIQAATTTTTTTSCSRTEIASTNHRATLVSSQQEDPASLAPSPLSLAVDRLHESANASNNSNSNNNNNDIGRALIRPLLLGQRLFQNNPLAPEPYRYWALDGFPIEEEGIGSYTLPLEAHEIVLASDGYPVLFRTLKETEEHLDDILQKDASLVGPSYLSTKGVRNGAESFDDRTYLRFIVGDAATDDES